MRAALALLAGMAVTATPVAVPAQSPQRSSSFWRVPEGACALPGAIAAPALFVEPASPRGPGDRLVTLRVCLRLADSTTAIGSLHATLAWDSTRARLGAVAVTRMGTLLHNARRPGDLTFAGAAPSGFQSGPLLVFELRPVTPGGLPAVTLSLAEMATTASRSVANEVKIAGWPRPSASAAPSVALRTPPADRPKTAPAAASVPARTPVVERVTPARVPLDAPEPPVLEITGRHFAAEGNTVVLGPATLTGIASANGGTLLRVVLPRTVSVADEAPPLRLDQGTYRLSVRTARGESNAVEITIR